MSRQARAIYFAELEGGCYVPLSHAVNSDGYFRKLWKEEGKGKIQEMFHRFIWRAKYGEITKGYEINHKCRNRACCNTDHLELLSRKEHLDLTNRTRYAARIAKGKEMIQEGIPKKDIAKELGVTPSTVANWVKQLAHF